MPVAKPERPNYMRANKDGSYSMHPTSPLSRRSSRASMSTEVTVTFDTFKRSNSRLPNPLGTPGTSPMSASDAGDWFTPGVKSWGKLRRTRQSQATPLVPVSFVSDSPETVKALQAHWASHAHRSLRSIVATSSSMKHRGEERKQSVTRRGKHNTNPTPGQPKAYSPPKYVQRTVSAAIVNKSLNFVILRSIGNYNTELTIT